MMSDESPSIARCTVGKRDREDQSVPRFKRKSTRTAYRWCLDPTAELVRQLRSLDEERVKRFLDVIAQLALEEAEREAERKYTVRIKSCA